MSFRFGARLVVACLAFFPLAQAGYSQTKVGVISLQRAILESAEIKQKSAEMEAKYKPRQDEIQKVQQDLENIRQQLQNNAGKLTPGAQEDLNAEYQTKQRQLQRLSEDLQSDVTAERNDILTESGRKMKQVVQKLAEEKGLDVVVDEQSTVFFKPALDITADAIAAYDKAYPAKAK